MAITATTSLGTQTWPARSAIDASAPALIPDDADTDALIAAIYEAALLPEGWSGLPDRLAQLLGGTRGALRRCDGLAPEPDGPRQAALTLADPGAGSGEWVLRIEGFRDPARMAEARRRLRRVRPHLAGAMGIVERRRCHDARLTVAALDHLGAGAAILDDSGRVLAANPRFMAQLGLSGTAAGEPADVPLRLGHRRDHAPLRATLAASIVAGRRGAVPIHDAAGSCVAALHLLPAGVPRGPEGGGPATVLVLVARPRADALPAPALLRDLFALTPAETTIAQAVARGDLGGDGAVAPEADILQDGHDAPARPRAARPRLRAARRGGRRVVTVSRLIPILQSPPAWPSPAWSLAVETTPPIGSGLRLRPGRDHRISEQIAHAPRDQLVVRESRSRFSVGWPSV